MADEAELKRETAEELLKGIKEAAADTRTPKDLRKLAEAFSWVSAARTPRYVPTDNEPRLSATAF